MANVKFIKKITDYVVADRTIIGNYVYYMLNNGNRIKAYCEDTGVRMEVINKMEGKVDGVFLPFANYFEPTQCSLGAPKWYQHIDNNHWYFEEMYKHVLPKDDDYRRLAEAMENYIIMYE